MPKSNARPADTDQAGAAKEAGSLGDGTPWGPAYRLMTIGLLITIVGSAFEALAVATILPKTADELGGLSLYGWVFSAYVLANMVGIVVASGEADRLGPTRPFVAGVVLFVAGLLIGGLAPTMLVLILGRVVQGLGGGCVSSVVYVAVGRGYPPAAKPRMLALLSSAWVVPGLIGPAFAGLIADHIGWRWVFLGLIPFPIIAVFMTLPALRHVPGGDVSSRDMSRVWWSVLLAGGTALLLAGFDQDRLLLAVPLIAVGVASVWKPLGRLLPAGTVRAAAGLPAAVAVMALVNGGFFGVDAYIPLGLTDVRDRSVSFAGLALTAATITWSAGAWIQARYVRRVSARSMVRVGLGLIVVGGVGAAAMLLDGVPVITGVFAWGFAGLGMGFAYSRLSLAVLEAAPKGQEGAATAAMQLGIVLLMAVTAGMGGVLVDAFGDDAGAIRTGLLVQDALMLAVLVGAILIAVRLPGVPSLLERKDEDGGGTAA
ncbi:MAG: MFS transporter [Thermomicrobiales bacterium]